MNRSQFLAACLVVAVLGALVATRIQSGSDATAESEAASDQEADGARSPAGQAASTEGAPDPVDGAAAGDAAADGGDADPAADAGGTDESTAGDEVAAADAPPILDPKPALTDIDGWINTDASSLDDFDGQVRVVEFWTFGCFNCKNRISHTQELYAEFRDDGLEIIGIHAPEFERERDPGAVLEATERLGVTWPVALDTNKTNFRAWQGNRRFWPRVYVLDQNGDLRYDHIGEGDYDGLTETVAHLIENGP